MNFQTASFKRPRPYRPVSYDPEPAEWQAFDRMDWAHPLVIDVGAGGGEWVVAEAQTQPQTNFIAIERSKNRYAALCKRVARARTGNVFAVRADAIALIRQKVPEKSVDAIYFFYPNPIPKRRQANQRYFVGSHFAVFHRALKENGTLYLVSNVKAYVDEASSYLEKIWDYEIVSCDKVAAKAPRTAFERKYRNRGEKPFELKAIKGNSHPSLFLFPSPPLGGEG